jgi:hypothetical protein
MVCYLVNHRDKGHLRLLPNSYLLTIHNERYGTVILMAVYRCVTAAHTSLVHCYLCISSVAFVELL